MAPLVVVKVPISFGFSMVPPYFPFPTSTATTPVPHSDEYAIPSRTQTSWTRLSGWSYSLTYFGS